VACQRRMAFPFRIGFSVAAGVLSLLVSSAGGCGRSAPAPAKIQVTQSVLKLRETEPGEELTGSFTIQNAGGQALQIEKLEIGCACASLSVSAESVQPGSEAVVKVVVRLRGEGQQRKFAVRIFSNDPEADVTVCTVEVEPAPAVVRTDAEQVGFGEVPIGTTPILRVKILKPDGSPWQPGESVQVEAANGMIVCQHSEVPSNADGTIFVEVQPRADLRPGPFGDMLLIRRPGNAAPLRVAVLGTIVTKLMVTPSVLLLKDLQPGPVKRQLVLRRTDGEPANRITKITAPDGMQVTEVESAKMSTESHLRRLQVSMDPAAANKVKNGKIQLWLEGEPEPITVRIMVLPGRTAGPPVP